ncbi:MAG: hypothetical protein HYZ14_07510 [Bacteroidetes bacterium]|nr:hypothetical protein [Bacteroidota bacterium]
MLSKRTKYDSNLAWFFSVGKDNLIPLHIKNKIPNSTIYTWRSTAFETYFGHEIRTIQKDALDYYELFCEHEKLKKTIRVISKVWISVSDILLPVLKKKKEYEELFVDNVQRMFTVFDRKTTFKIAAISASSFSDRLSKIKVKCGLSVTQICLKKHPLQLAEYEVKKIKELFVDVKLVFWPAISLYYEGLKNRGLFISSSTFYKYVNLLGLKRKWKTPLKKLPGLKSSFPNHYLHVDTTYYEFQPGMKAAIVFVSDNFSKNILGWSIALKNSAENVKNALKMAIETIHQYHPEYLCTTLVADGGSENHAVTIEELLRKTDHPVITKIIALKDISFSNSSIEAINKIAKRYLRILDPRTFEKLITCVEFFVFNYSHKRPHGSLKGLTPFEAYTKPGTALTFQNEMIKAKQKRIAFNQTNSCKMC